MTKNGNSLDQRTFDKLSRLYIIALSTIALSVIISQILIRKHLSDQESDSSIINVAGRQRMLSQKLTKEIVLLSTADDVKDRISLLNKLKETLSLWELSHNSLQQGNDDLGLPGNNSEVVRDMFSAINSPFKKIQRASYSIITKLENKPNALVSSFLDEVNKVKETENDFLLLMDAIVNQYDLEANEKVSWLGKLELFLMTLTLLLLLGEFMFIFWPLPGFPRRTRAPAGA